VSRVTEYVVCSACGTRIKAGREYCLRCFEPLPSPDARVQPSILVSLGWSRGKQLTVAAAASLAALTLVAIIWQTAPQQIDAASGPAVVQPRPTPPAPAIRPAVPVTAVDPQVERALPRNGDEPFFDTPCSPSDGDGARYQQTLARFKIARAAADAGEWTRAIDEYGGAARLSGDDANAQYNFGLALHRRGDEHDAIAMFHKAISLAPDETMFHLALAAALENAGRIAEAVGEYNAFVTAHPNAPEADRLRSRIDALSAGKFGDGRSR
jgi:tetratricopeptide (TPR) repeat protein